MFATAIPPARWATFADKFSRQHRGWLVSVEVTDTRRLDLNPYQAEIDSGVLAREQALRAVTLDETGGVSQFRIVVGEEPDRVVHRTGRPVNVQFEMAEDGAHQGLRVDGDDGTTTRVRFRTPAHPETLDGIGAAEW